MTSDKENKEKSISKILYIGGDKAYFENIKLKFKEFYPGVTTEFEYLDAKDSTIIQSYILKVREVRPKIVLLDYSENEKHVLHLTRVIARQNFYTKIIPMGLCDYKQSKSIIVRAIMTTMPCVHIKSSEYEAICYDIVSLAFPENLAPHGFATAELNDEIHAFHPCKISLINENFFRIESSHALNAKQVFRLMNYWANKRIVRSSLVMCVDQSQENLYYNYKYTQVLQMAHADPVEQTDDMTQEDYEEKQLKRTETVEESRYKLRRWLTSNADNSRPKFLKVYAIDKEDHFYNFKPATDSYPFVLRCQPFINNAKKELVNLKPHMIIYNLEVVDKETLEANADIAHTYNDSRVLQHLIKVVKEISDAFRPVIIVFNSGEYDSAYMQKVFSYANILAVKEPMEYELTIKMIDMLKAKITPNLPLPNKGDVYIDKTTELSYGEIESEITLMACSENDVYFNSNEKLEKGTVLRVSLPVPMYITIVTPPEQSSITSDYYAIIHGIGEEERKELRRYIYSIFFRDHDMAKAADFAEFEKMKQVYVENQRKAAEEAKLAQEAKEKEAELEKKRDAQTTDKAQGIVDQLGED